MKSSKARRLSGPSKSCSGKKHSLPPFPQLLDIARTLITSATFLFIAQKHNTRCPPSPKDPSSCSLEQGELDARARRRTGHLLRGLFHESLWTKLTVLKSGIPLTERHSGFIAVHCLKELLDRGYKVRGTVRSTEKGDYLKKKFPGFEYVYVAHTAWCTMAKGKSADERFAVSEGSSRI